MGDVIDLFAKRKKKLVEQNKKEKEKAKEKNLSKTLDKSLDEVIHLNLSNWARMRKEREQANKNVMKSYKIK